MGLYIKDLGLKHGRAPYVDNVQVCRNLQILYLCERLFEQHDTHACQKVLSYARLASSNGLQHSACTVQVEKEDVAQRVRSQSSCISSCIN